LVILINNFRSRCTSRSRIIKHLSRAIWNYWWVLI